MKNSKGSKNKNLLSISKACDFCKLPKAAIRKAAKSGLLHPVDRNGQFLYHVDDL